MKTAMFLGLLAASAILGALRLALRPRARCEVCGCEVDPDPLDAAPICAWHWSQGGDA